MCIFAIENKHQSLSEFDSVIMYRRVFLILVYCIISVSVYGQPSSACPQATTECTDFWATFMPNGLIASTGSYADNAIIGFIASGQNNATITVTNDQLGYSGTFNHTGGTKTFMQLPTSHWDTTSARPSTMGYHITSSAPIFLYASNYQRSGWDICNILPSSSLGTNYIVQDYHNTSSTSSQNAITSALVATSDNTTIRMVLPCRITGSPLNVGDTLTVTLDAGESFLLRSRSANVMFSGMPVFSDKPIALFQGHSGAIIGQSGGRDPLFEQARPIEMWGHEFIATSTKGRSEGDMICITSAADNCTVSFDGNYQTTIQAGESLTHTLPSNSALYIQTSQPCYVALYTWSYNYGTVGDPAMIPIIPVERWVCNADFPIHNCNTDMSDAQRIADDHHYVNIVTATAAAGDLLLDGQPINDFVNLPSGYSYARKVVPPGAHSITSSSPFCAHAYGMGRWVGYGFAVTHACDTSECVVVSGDTIEHKDTVCMGTPYLENGFNLSENETSVAGTIERWWVDESSSPLQYHHLNLTILSSFRIDTTISLNLGDSLLLNDTTIMDPGIYSFTYTASNGCDSLINYIIKLVSDCSEFLQFPSVITPNGDGVNDVFKVVNLIEEDCYPFNRLIIYNRWGVKIFEANNIKDETDFWNPADDDSPEGTYYYRFDGIGFKGRVERKGVIEVLRYKN